MPGLPKPDVHAVTVHKLHRPDAVIAYEAAGEGSPLLFLHGVGSSRQTWRRQLDFFSERYLSVAMDCRGYGESVTSINTVSMTAFAADAAALIRDLGRGPAHVCGLSMGGIVALTLWRDAPEVIGSLVLADTWAHHPTAAAAQEQRLAQIDSTSMSNLARQRMPAVYGPHAAADLVERGVRLFAAIRKDVYRSASADLWIADRRQVAATVTVPTLILVGELDSITPTNLSAELTRLIPGSRLTVIPGVGHLANEEAPEIFNHEVDKFLVTPPQRGMDGR
jgi:pimeloyl-ACP methyl ester carboxylesterase